MKTRSSVHENGKGQTNTATIGTNPAVRLFKFCESPLDVQSLEARVVQWLRSPPPTRRTRIRFPAGVEFSFFNRGHFPFLKLTRGRLRYKRNYIFMSSAV